jgi:hypothetical protein
MEKFNKTVVKYCLNYILVQYHGGNVIKDTILNAEKIYGRFNTIIATRILKRNLDQWI